MSRLTFGAVVYSKVGIINVVYILVLKKQVVKNSRLCPIVAAQPR
jgi:hypothetical protein